MSAERQSKKLRQSVLSFCQNSTKEAAGWFKEQTCTQGWRLE